MLGPGVVGGGMGPDPLLGLYGAECSSVFVNLGEGTVVPMGGCGGSGSGCDVNGQLGICTMSLAPLDRSATSGNNSRGPQAPNVSPQPTLKFKPPSWRNFTHEFLPCYGAQLTANFFVGDGLVGTTGAVALTAVKPIFGAPVFAIWVGLNAFRAGSACALASRGYYQ